MANYRQYYYDGEWHDYKKGKEPVVINTLAITPFNPVDNMAEVAWHDYLWCRFLEDMMVWKTETTSGEEKK